MDIELFEWDSGNTAHVAEHGLTPEEVEDALADANRRTLPVYSPPVEIREGTLGVTQSGRLLFIVFTFRGSRLRVVTAGEANRDTERPLYLQRGQ